MLYGSYVVECSDSIILYYNNYEHFSYKLSIKSFNPIA